MIIAISGSMAFADRMLQIKAELEAAGHVVATPIANSELKSAYKAKDDGRIISLEHDLMAEHIDRIKKCSALLVVNEAKNGINGYVGTNVLIELGSALALGKKIYLLRQPSKELPQYYEVMATYPTVLNGDLQKMEL